MSPCLSQHITTTPTASRSRGLQGAMSSTFPARAHEPHHDSSLDKSKHEQLLREGELHTTSQLLLPCPAPGGAGGNVWAGGALGHHKEPSRTHESLVVSLVCVKEQPHQRYCWKISGKPFFHATSTQLSSLLRFYQRLKSAPH